MATWQSTGEAVVQSATGPKEGISFAFFALWSCQESGAYLVALVGCRLPLDMCIFQAPESVQIV